MLLLTEVFADQSYTYLQTGSPIVALMKSCDLGPKYVLSHARGTIF